MKPTDDQQFEAELVKLLNHVDRCVLEFEGAAAAFSMLETFDVSARIMLRELGLAGARVYNATSAVQKRLQREAVARPNGLLGVEGSWDVAEGAVPPG
jgi:hypothetical protein